ncbi:tail fiber component [Pseudomonas phage vB_PaeP_SPCB]|nr:tail fiber protein [Pseudomonas phage PT5]YP_006299963.1 tail fiber protein [Pseudomonas phage vB_Pae-TbilisiM32]YP_009125742.1 tail fiber protein [Pseudomonas phage vB_PaeP_PAO1_Ab05]QGJ86825.1 tail fiber component [Pseudomonas phage vB_PaeP_SPCB]QGJ86862.1 tail fiber component [Pseudomonas phage vB_PaeP_SPCG]QQL99217.1 hypothetical protein [Pseudomonas phage HX1]WFG36906.1 tail fiber protein [Pseudomonas phage 20Aug401]ABW23122.1 conserved hypothetical phage protein [Pseudomonas phage P
MRGIIAGIMASQIRRPKPILATYPYPILATDDTWSCQANIVAALTRDTLHEVVNQPGEDTYQASAGVVEVLLRSLTQLGYGGGDGFLTGPAIHAALLRDTVKGYNAEPYAFLSQTAVVGAELKVVVVYSEYIVEPYAFATTTAIKQAELTNV